MKIDLKGKTALVTGASYGLGAAFAEALAEDGADLVLTARTEPLLEEVAARCRARGRKVTVVAGDVSVPEDVSRVVATAVASHDRIDVLVNNAGVADMRGLAAEQYDTETFSRIVQVDLFGAFFYLRDVGRQMLDQGSGSIVNICSIMADGANELNVIAYTAAKGGLLNLTKQLGAEWADRGVRVNAVSPGFVVTDMTRPLFEAMGISQYVASRTPMRRLGEVSEVVPPVLFLASDLSSYVTGVNLCVDGGTNACNGWWQVPPIHYDWNADTGPMVGERYEGLMPRPDFLEQTRAGIPGLHYPMPEGPGPA